MGEAIQLAKERVPSLVPLLHELRIRREGAKALNRLVELERRRRTFSEALKDSPVVAEVTADIRALRGRMRELNDALRGLSDEPQRPVE